MRNVVFASLIAAGVSFAGMSAAGAAPLNGAAVDQAAPSADVIQVAQGCGPGRHWSKWRGACVWDQPRGYYYGGYPAYGYGYPAYGYGYYPRGYYYRGW